MEDGFLEYYNRELRHVRETAGEFGKAFPKIAGRLGMESLEVADPYVERLLEGFAFMAARVQLKIDAKHPQFTQQLLDIIYPHYQAQMPAMAVVELQPAAQEGSLVGGFPIPRQTALWSKSGAGSKTTACEFRTTQDLTLWPVLLTQVKYYSSDSAIAAADWCVPANTRAGIRLNLKTAQGLSFNQLTLDELNIYLSGEDELPMKIYEQIFANGCGFMLRGQAPDGQNVSKTFYREQCFIHQVGFDDDEAALPFPQRSFQGYRLLQEYFSFPERFMFFKLTGLVDFLKQCSGEEVEIMILLNRSHAEMSSAIVTENFRLHCVPVINLFPKKSERVQLQNGQHNYHVSPDRTRPMDFEIYAVNKVEGFSGGTEADQQFVPFYGLYDHASDNSSASFYSTLRKPRQLSSLQKKNGPRSSYIGSEVYLSIVDAKNAPYSTELKQLGVDLLCTNRDLPLHMPVGRGGDDFTLESGAPVDSIRVIVGPSKPVASKQPSEASWQFINHLSLNYLSLQNEDSGHDAVALREMLRLYGDMQDTRIEKQIEAVRTVRTETVVRQMPVSGMVAYGRGVRVIVECDESGFEGQGFYLFGAILERFFAKYVSLNSFTEMVLISTKRGEVKTWTARCGSQQML